MWAARDAVWAERICAELGTDGHRRVMLLGSSADVRESRLRQELARRGLQVLAPPEQVQGWLDQVIATELAQGVAPDVTANRLEDLMEEGREHGVEAALLLCEELALVVGQVVELLPCVEVWRGRLPGQVRNIVFDMGGVLLRWEPLRMARAACDSDEDALLLADAVFGSPEWAWQDAGAVDEETVAWAARRLVPERLHANVEQLVYHWHDARDFMPDTGGLIHELKAAGYGIYLLSNAGESFLAYRDQLPAVECFDGMVVSCFEHVVKPDARIYRILCDRYGLEPSSCLFVDDTQKNVDAAQRVGMHGWRFDGNVGALRHHILHELP